MEVCQGCGAKFYSTDTAVDKDFNALHVCRLRIFDLSYYTLSLKDEYFVHQLAVDAYTAQHVGKDTKPISIMFALIGLFLVNEKGYTGKQVQGVHMMLAKKTKVWPHFLPPADKTWLTVQDVLLIPDEEKQEIIKKWNQSVWNIWKKDEKQIEIILQKHNVL